MFRYVGTICIHMDFLCYLTKLCLSYNYFRSYNTDYASRFDPLPRLCPVFCARYQLKNFIIGTQIDICCLKNGNDTGWNQGGSPKPGKGYLCTWETKDGNIQNYYYYRTKFILLLKGIPTFLYIYVVVSLLATSFFLFPTSLALSYSLLVFQKKQTLNWHEL